MSESEPESQQIMIADHPQPKNQLPKKAHRLAFTLLIVLLFIAVVALAGALGFLWRQVSVQHQKWQQLQMTMKQQVATQQATVTQQLATLQQQSQDHQQILVNLQQQLQRVAAPALAQRNWQRVSQIDFQLHLANQYLLAGVINLPLALRLVQSAQQELKSINIPAVVELQQALKTLQQQLQQLPPINFANLIQQLDLLAAQSDKLLTTEQLRRQSSSKPVVTNKANTSTVVAPQAAASAHWYQRSWAAVHDYFGQLVTVRHEVQPVPTVSAQAMQLVNNQIKVLLLQAKWALLQQNQAMYQNSLNQCRELLLDRFPDQPVRATLLSKLKDLAQIDLSPMLPSFSPVFAGADRAAAALLEQTEAASPAKNTMLPKTKSEKTPLDQPPEHPDEVTKPLQLMEPKPIVAPGVEM